MNANSDTSKTLRHMKKDARIVQKMLELGDDRLMAHDGPCGGKLPELSPEEWGKVYRACKRIAGRLL